MENLEKYKKIFMEVFNVSPEQLTDDFTFDNIVEWDSLAHLTLISELEDAFDIMFEIDDILHFGGFNNGIKILTNYGIVF